MQIADNTVVTLDYTLTDDDGNVLDSTQGQGNFAYLHGASNIIPGLESALTGKTIDDELTVHVDPAQGYGERTDEMIQSVPREMFDTDQEINVGMQFHAQATSGQMVVVTVTEISDDTVTVDGNHPLAGTPLNFDVKVVGVREATADEISHGHAHGPEGHADH